jgi:hypothetical protein
LEIADEEARINRASRRGEGEGVSIVHVVCSDLLFNGIDFAGELSVLVMKYCGFVDLTAF